VSAADFSLGAPRDADLQKPEQMIARGGGAHGHLQHLHPPPKSPKKKVHAAGGPTAAVSPLLPRRVPELPLPPHKQSGFLVPPSAP
jgi:hypothetical protein